ncbi:protein phosphatase 2C [Bacillus toyonensis]|uniref:protein phosphatase 2C n=1 Tax=Bacillus toyonensis TaxID=155322 RepID=UPI000BF1F7CE|nr:protein phosphatase 2C [Bacillus toyonensis]PEK41930.1 protein phosphatase 2C [Bacillus toyonensis]PFZ36697.1 protein phosphatase 2C [Bacillus toyonensis]
MDKMLQKIKRIMVVAAAAVTLSVGFATFAPKEASAHWADPQINWALQNKIITADMRDSLATRQDMWLMMMRKEWKYHSDYNFNSAQAFVVVHGYSDGSRGTNWVTRSEAAAMASSLAGYKNLWNPATGFSGSDRRAKKLGIFDGTRGNEFATRAEVVTMIYNSRYA